MTAVEYRPGASAAEADRSLRHSLAALDQARRCAALWFAEVMDRRLYRELGHPTVEVYAKQALGFSDNRTRQFIALAARMRRMPVLRRSVAAGRLGWTSAQEVSRVITPASETHWVERAEKLPRAALRREIAAARGRPPAPQLELAPQAVPQPPPEPPPTTVTLRFDALRYARFEALCEAAKKSGAVPAKASRDEMVLAGLAALTESAQPVRRQAAAQVIVRRCPDCEAAFAVTSQGAKRLAPAAVRALDCDAIERDARGYNRATIPPAIRRQVLDRDGHRCATPGCTAARFLEVHHVVARKNGGSNRVENLTTLCHRCHRAAHEP